MKILQVIPRFNPILGGGVNVVYNTSKALAKRGHEIRFITYAMPTRLSTFTDNIFYHEVEMNN